ncbi:MAG: chorismate synthase [Armatimonadetes bacterium]|nr:chorismate synthase [Armatimonadota bacterium]
MFRFLTAGESHGQMLMAVIDGVPAGLEISAEQIDRDLARRQKGHGRGGRMKIEHDTARIVSGVRHGRSLGGPIALMIENRDWQAWSKKMAVEPGEVEASDPTAVFVPRPGHADLAGVIKYGHADMRNVLERASARETAARTAVGAVAKRILEEAGVGIAGHVVAIGSVQARKTSLSPQEIRAKSEESPVRCVDPEAESQMIQAIDAAKEEGDTLGGLFEVIAAGVPVGLGSYAQWDRRLDGEIARAVMSIPAIKGVEIGLGFEAAKLPGSEVHDEIGYEQGGYFRFTNRAGGLEGGVTNGEPVVVRAAMKPIPTLIRRLRSVDTRTKEPAPAHAERSDVCAVPAASVVGEAMVAIALVGALTEKFGGDSMRELKANMQAYKSMTE